MSDNPSTSTPTVWFPVWAEVLQQQEKLSSFQRQQYRRAIIDYLRFCKRSRLRATVDSARRFMQQMKEERQLTPTQAATWKQALNWFFEAARQPRLPGGPAQVETATSASPRSAPVRPAAGPMMEVPSWAARDLGRTAWEQRLVRELRTRHYQWRTEQTYRTWASGFARWLEERGQTVESAGEGNVRDFLSEVATRQRGSASTQKQALNALVFLLREALAKPLADFSDFIRARKRLNVPVVLTREECQRLFAALDGTMQLMAELMYGSGLRLTGLLGLRVKDADLNRRQLIVRAGKGGKDRVTMVPESLGERLRTQRERLRKLHAEDQRNGVPGVWLPEGLDRKYPKAGEA